MVIMNRLDAARRAQVVRCLVEGNSIRSTVRMTGVSKNTITKLLLELGAACTMYQDEVFRKLNCKLIQVDEIWSFVYCKEAQVTDEIAGERRAGDVWTWTAIDAETKLIPSWLVGQRTADCARDFIDDLASRLANRVQLTSDALKVYLKAVDNAFGNDIDYAQLHKIYDSKKESGRYSPPECVGCDKIRRIGNPDQKYISTSYVERQNLSMRMSMRRFTRLTNGFSKKIKNHAAAIALYFMWYNFGRKHMTLKTTPAVAAGVADHIWTVEEIIDLLDRPLSN